MSEYCTSCGRLLDGDFAFCPGCGKVLPKETAAARFCTRCGKPVEDNAAFCTACGAPLAPVVTPAEAPITPEEPASVSVAEPAPVEPAPVEPAPVPVAEPAPVEPAPVEPAPVAAVEPVPVEPVPVPVRRFCTGCGKAIEGDPDFCTACGKSLKGAPAPVSPVESPRPSSLKSKLTPKVLTLLGIGAAALLALILILVFTLGGGSYTDPFDHKIEIMLADRYTESDLKRLAPDAYWEERDADWDEILEAANEENIRAMLEREFGDNLKITYEIVDETKLSIKKLRDINKTLDELYAIEATEGYTLDLEMKISGSKDEETETGTATVLCIDGKWYSYPFSFGV